MWNNRPVSRLVRSASLSGFVELCRGFGADPFALIAEAGLPPSCLADPDTRIDVRKGARALELAAERTGARDFGLRLAEARRLSNLGLVGLIGRDQPTLREAIHMFGHYMWMHNESLALHLQEFDDIAIWQANSAAIGGSRQAMELAVGVMMRGLRSLLGTGWSPEAVQLRSPAPADSAVAMRLFGVRPQHGSALDGIVIGRHLLDAPLQGADPGMSSHVEQMLHRLRPAQRRGWTAVVEEMVVLLLPTGRCSADRVASHLGVDRRTLHRWLVAEGTSFRRLVHERRMAIAGALLAQGRSATAVADLAGFASASAFSHWHLRAFGCPPRAIMQHRAGRRRAPSEIPLARAPLPSLGPMA